MDRRKTNKGVKKNHPKTQRIYLAESDHNLPLIATGGGKNAFDNPDINRRHSISKASLEEVKEAKLFV